MLDPPGAPSPTSTYLSHEPDGRDKVKEIERLVLQVLVGQCNDLHGHAIHVSS